MPTTKATGLLQEVLWNGMMSAFLNDARRTKEWKNLNDLDRV